MRYTEFKAGDNEYKLRLATGEVVNIEKKINGNVLDIFMREGEIPTIGELMMVLHGSLQKFHHGTKITDVYDIYDTYIDDGNTFEELIEVIMDVFEVSGFFKKEQLEEGKIKIKEQQEIE